MDIYFSQLLTIQSPVHFLSEKLSLSSLKQKVMIIATAILSCAAFYYFCRYRFKAKQVDPEKIDFFHGLKKEANRTKEDGKKKLLHKIEEGKKVLSLDIPVGQMKALEVYMKNPEKCGKTQKTIIFKDIKHIEFQHKNTNDVSSVIGLMLYLSGLSEVDLRNPLCARVVVDVFKECNKETSEQLSAWLSREDTFNIALLKECLKVFIDKQEQQLPFSDYSIVLLMKIYKGRNWHLQHPGKESNLPSNHQIVVSAMAMLIKSTPNENRIIALTEWFMNQSEYDLQTFSTWICIFKQKEQEKEAQNLYYPLLNKLIIHFKKKLGTKHVKELDASILDYLQYKDPLFNPRENFLKMNKI